MPRKVLVWVLDPGPPPRVLLLRRARSVSVPGWHPITGNVEDAEDLAEAARREVEEETGLAVEPVDLGVEHSFERYGKRFVERAFVAFATGPVRLSGEHDGAEWVDPEEAGRRVGFPSQRHALVEATNRARDGRAR